MVCTVAYIKKHIRLLHMIGGGGVNVALFFLLLNRQCFKHTLLLVWQTNNICIEIIKEDRTKVIFELSSNSDE